MAASTVAKCSAAHLQRWSRRFGVAVIPSEVEESLFVDQKIIRDVSTVLDMTRD